MRDMKNETKSPVRRLLAALAVVTMIGVAAPVALAQQGGISDARARAIALRAVPGEVVEIEREDDELEVLVRARDGRLMEVEIDPRSGRVLEVEAEDDDEHEDDDGEVDDD